MNEGGYEGVNEGQVQGKEGGQRRSTGCKQSRQWQQLRELLLISPPYPSPRTATIIVTTAAAATTGTRVAAHLFSPTASTTAATTASGANKGRVPW